MSIKCGNKRVRGADGRWYDSVKEMQRSVYLQALERAGYITNLQFQVKYVLIPEKREPDTIGKRGGVKKGKLIEKECYYVADFVYFDAKTGEMIVEDAKGHRDPKSATYAKYTIKRKLMLHVYGIRILET